MPYGAKGQILDSSEAAGRNTNSIMNGWVDRGPWFYWDTLTVAAGTTLANSYQLFSVPIGAQDPVTSTTKTLLQTNMVRGNQFPPPRCLLLQKVGFYLSSTMIKADVDKFLDGCVLRLTIDEKVFHEGPPVYYSAGVGLSGVTTQTGESAYSIGLPGETLAKRFGDWSKYIAPQQQFNVTLLFPATPTLTTTDNGGTGLKVQVQLDGLTDRSVQ